MHNKNNRFMSVTTLFLLCWFAYFTCYVGKRNFSAAIPEMIASGILDKPLAGSINTVFFICYGVFQPISGILADRIDPRRQITVGLAGGALANFCMSFTTLRPLLLLFWGINGCALSMIWPPILRLFSDLPNEDDRTRCAVNITTSVAAGSLGAYLISSLMIWLGGWRWVFRGAAILQITAAILWALFPQKTLTMQKKDLPNQQKLPMRKLLCGGVLLMCISVLLQGALRDGVSSWVPTYLADAHGLPSSVSALISALLPIACLIGPYVAYFLNRRIFHAEGKVSAFLFLLSAICLAALFFFGKVGTGLSVALLCAVSCVVEGINVMFLCMIPLHYHYIGCTATLTSLFNFMGYIGAALSSYGTGVVAQFSGWLPVILIWLGCAVVGFLLCLLTRLRKDIPKEF